MCVYMYIYIYMCIYICICIYKYIQKLLACRVILQYMHFSNFSIRQNAGTGVFMVLGRLGRDTQQHPPLLVSLAFGCARLPAVLAPADGARF